MKIGVGIAVFALIAFGVYWYVAPALPELVENETAKTFSSEKYGLEFSYPGGYYLEEREVGNVERGHYLVMLYDDTEENTAVREGRAPGREGPVSITIDIHQNNLDGLSAEKWIRNTSASNFKMSPDGIITPFAVGKHDGFTYRWSGLYDADAVVVANDSNVYVFTVTFIKPEDSIRDVFDSIIESVSVR